MSRKRTKANLWSPQDGWHDRARLHGHGFEPFFLALVHASCPSIIRAQDSPRGQLSSHPALHSMTRRGRAGSVMEGRRDLPIGERNSRPTASSLSMRGEPSACGAMPRTSRLGRAQAAGHQARVRGRGHALHCAQQGLTWPAPITRNRRVCGYGSTIGNVLR